MAHVGEELRLVLACFRDLAALVLDIVEQPHVAPALMSSKIRCGRALLRPSPLCVSGSCPTPCGREQASGIIIDGPGQKDHARPAAQVHDALRSADPVQLAGREPCSARTCTPAG
jgi:hypothetical protein